MSDIKLNGGDTSSTLLKITRGTIFPIRFKPNFRDQYTPEEIGSFIRDRLKVYLYNTSAGDTSFINSFNGFNTGGEVIFNLNLDIDAETAPNFSILLAKVVLLPEVIVQDPDDEGPVPPEETLAETVFQIIPVDTVSAETTLFGLLNTLPTDLQNLQDIRVALKRSDREDKPDRLLWQLIKRKTNDISFNRYNDFMNAICAGNTDVREEVKNEIKTLSSKRLLPFTDTDGYRTIKVLTEAFLLVNCSANLETDGEIQEYLEATAKEGVNTLPFLKRLREKFVDLDVKLNSIGDILDLFNGGQLNAEDQDCFGILKKSLVSPCFIELIWNYWHEESMLVQSLNAISRRFQNVRNGSRDPLAGLEIAPLRPLNNLLWGYIQDEQHRLTLTRRAFEYDHHYGFTLKGKAIRNLQTADSRVNFLQAFHQLLNLCIKFFKEEDDTTVIADGFPILNALREVHLILSEGMHNQYGDLPFTSRVEMMSQQWLLARPEFREFLPTRAMVAYPEPWMDRVAAMNSIQGWTNSSPVHFSNLGIHGENILLSIRYGNWNDPNIDGDQAAVWANFFRNNIQGYIHAYRSITGIDLTFSGSGKVNALPPSFHLQKRLQEQKRTVRVN